MQFCNSICFSETHEEKSLDSYLNTYSPQKERANGPYSGQSSIQSKGASVRSTSSFNELSDISRVTRTSDSKPYTPIVKLCQLK